MFAHLTGAPRSTSHQKAAHVGGVDATGRQRPGSRRSNFTSWWRALGVRRRAAVVPQNLPGQTGADDGGQVSSDADIGPFSRQRVGAHATTQSAPPVLHGHMDEVDVCTPYVHKKSQSAPTRLPSYANVYSSAHDSNAGVVCTLSPTDGTVCCNGTVRAECAPANAIQSPPLNAGVLSGPGHAAAQTETYGESFTASVLQTECTVEDVSRQAFTLLGRQLHANIQQGLQGTGNAVGRLHVIACAQALHACRSGTTRDAIARVPGLAAFLQVVEAELIVAASAADAHEIRGQSQAQGNSMSIAGATDVAVPLSQVTAPFHTPGNTRLLPVPAVSAHGNTSPVGARQRLQVGSGAPGKGTIAALAPLAGISEIVTVSPGSGSESAASSSSSGGVGGNRGIKTPVGRGGLPGSPPSPIRNSGRPTLDRLFRAMGTEHSDTRTGVRIHSGRGAPGAASVVQGPDTWIVSGEEGSRPAWRVRKEGNDSMGVDKREGVPYTAHGSEALSRSHFSHPSVTSHTSYVSSEGFDGFEEYAAELDREQKMGVAGEGEGQGVGEGDGEGEREERMGAEAGVMGEDLGSPGLQSSVSAVPALHRLHMHRSLRSGVELDRGIRLEVVMRGTAQDGSHISQMSPAMTSCVRQGTELQSGAPSAVSFLSTPGTVVRYSGSMTEGPSHIHGWPDMIAAATDIDSSGSTHGTQSATHDWHENSSITGVSTPNTVRPHAGYPRSGGVVPSCMSSATRSPAGWKGRAGGHASPAGLSGAHVSVPRLSFVLPSPLIAEPKNGSTDVSALDTGSSRAGGEAQSNGTGTGRAGGKGRHGRGPVRALSLSMSFSFQDEFVAEVTRQALVAHVQPTDSDAQGEAGEEGAGTVGSYPTQGTQGLPPAAEAMLQELADMPTYALQQHGGQLQADKHLDSP